MNRKHLHSCVVLMCILLQGCEAEDPGVDLSSSEANLRLRVESIDVEYFDSLDRLARDLALHQDELRSSMLEGMRTSKIKENIINLSSVMRSDLPAAPSSRFSGRIESIYDGNSLNRSSSLSLRSTLNRISKDINIYFPVEEHRDNVLRRGQSYRVAFSSPLRPDGEYFVTAYDKLGQTKLLSSQHVPQENVMVIAYSEHQEDYSKEQGDGSVNLLPQQCDPEEGGCDGGGGGGGGGGGTVVYYEGFRLTSVRTDEITDGWLDGDLELMIKIHQLALTVSHPLGTSVISAYTFMNVYQDHDAGSWGIFGWDDSNRWTRIDAYRKWSERLSVTVAGVTLYNPIFLVEVKEDDPIADDTIGEVSFDANTFTWGSALYVLNGSKKCRVVLDKGLYPSTVY